MPHGNEQLDQFIHDTHVSAFADNAAYWGGRVKFWIIEMQDSKSRRYQDECVSSAVQCAVYARHAARLAMNEPRQR